MHESCDIKGIDICKNLGPYKDKNMYKLIFSTSPLKDQYSQTLGLGLSELLKLGSGHHWAPSWRKKWKNCVKLKKKNSPKVL